MEQSPCQALQLLGKQAVIWLLWLYPLVLVRKGEMMVWVESALPQIIMTSADNRRQELIPHNRLANDVFNMLWEDATVEDEAELF